MTIEPQRDRTTVTLYDDTKKALDNLGSKNDSYDDIIKRLLEEHYKNTPQNK
jgi:predicted CopG family antitoxin